MLTLAFWQKFDRGKRISVFVSKRTRVLIFLAFVVAGFFTFAILTSPKTLGFNDFHLIFPILTIVFLSGSYGFEVYGKGINVQYLGYSKWIAFEDIAKFGQETTHISRFTLVIYDRSKKNCQLNFENAEQVELFKTYLQTVGVHGGNP